MADSQAVFLKWFSLTCLVVQTVGCVYMIRVSRTTPVTGPRYLSTVAIFMAEIMKLVVCLMVHWWTSPNTRTCISELWIHTGAHPVGWLKTSVPALLYTLQNNLLFIALSNLTAGTFQVTYQLKILSTAAMSVLLLDMKLSCEKWFSLVVLTMGVMLVNAHAPNASSTKDKEETQNSYTGIAAVVVACCTSALAGVYLEKILKQSQATLWIRNIQLSLFSISFAYLAAFQVDGKQIGIDGMLQGFSMKSTAGQFAWATVCMHAVGGLVVSAVLKYADNILKCFGCSIAIIFVCMLSVHMDEFTPDAAFYVGTSLVLMSTVIYSIGLPNVEGFYSKHTKKDPATIQEAAPLIPKARDLLV